MFDVNITRFIMNGKVIFAMFGLPGAALAMYHCAKPERKPQVKALLIAAIIPPSSLASPSPLSTVSCLRLRCCSWCTLAMQVWPTC